MKSLLARSITILLTSLVLAGCATLSDADFEAVQPAPMPPHADFSVQPANGADSTGLTVAIADPNYNVDISSGAANASELSSDLRNSLSTSIQMVLTNTGLVYSGSFGSLREMTFPQKDKIMMVMVPSITISLHPEARATQVVYWKTGFDPSVPMPATPFRLYKGEVYRQGGMLFAKGQMFDLGYPDKFLETGQYNFQANIRIKLIEPLSGQLIWEKDVPLSGLSQNWSYYFWQTIYRNPQGQVTNTVNHPVYGFDSRDWAMTSLLMQGYHSLMAQLAQAINSGRLPQFKEDVRKLKDRWRSGGH